MCEAAFRHCTTPYLVDLGTMNELFKSPRTPPIRQPGAAKGRGAGKGAKPGEAAGPVLVPARDEGVGAARPRVLQRHAIRAAGVEGGRLGGVEHAGALCRSEPAAGRQRGARVSPAGVPSVTLWMLLNDTSTSGAARSPIAIFASPRNTSGRSRRNEAEARSFIPTMMPVHAADPTPVGVVPGVPDDGVVFDVAGVQAAPIRDEGEYPGVRVRTSATIAGARLPRQIDVGFGEVITPEAIEIEYPILR